MPLSEVTQSTPWTVAYQAPPSMKFSGQEYWSGLPYPSPGDHPDPGIEPVSPMSSALQADSLPTEPSGKPLYQGPIAKKGITVLFKVIDPGCQEEAWL